MVRVEPGEQGTVRAAQHRPLDHDFILGDDAVQRRHEQAGNATTTARSPASASWPPPGCVHHTYAFPAALDGRVLEFACHRPRHYAYGMHGTVRVA